MADAPQNSEGNVSEERICWQCGETYAGHLEFCPEDGSQLVEIDPAETKDMLVGRVFDHRFRIVRKLGEGGMSRVYGARRLEGEGRVALKVLKADFLRDPEVRKRFMYEARVIANLEHPNAVDLFDFGQAPDGSFYMVMELLHGESLADRLDRGALTYREIFEFLPPICGVLDEAHQQDVIHRDLKPENIYLADKGGELAVPKLLDFGIAKHLRSRTMTKNDQLWGTPAYMSPEQASGEAVAGTADIYAMGVMLYELVAGVLPFRASTAMGYAVKHMHREAEPIASLPGIRDIPERLDAFILHMIDKEPGERPPSMERVARELRNIERDVFDARLLGTIPADQVDESQLEAPSDEEPKAPGEAGASPEIDEALQDAHTALMDQPEVEKRADPAPSSERPRGSGVARTSGVPGGSARHGSEFETQPTAAREGGAVRPWFRRPRPLIGLALLAGGAMMTAYFAYAEGWEAFGGSEPSTQANATAQGSPAEESDESTAHASDAAGWAANVGIKARAIASSVAEQRRAAAVQEEEDGGGDDEPPEETMELGGDGEADEEDEEIETFQLESDSDGADEKRAGDSREEPAQPHSSPEPDGPSESGGESESAGREGEDKKEAAAADRESSGGDDGNVDEVLESTF